MSDILLAIYTILLALIFKYTLKIIIWVVTLMPFIGRIATKFSDARNRNSETKNGTTEYTRGYPDKHVNTPTSRTVYTGKYKKWRE